MKTAQTIFITYYAPDMDLVRREKQGWVREMQLLVNTGSPGGNGVSLLCDQAVSLSFSLRLCLILGATQSSCIGYKPHGGQGVNTRAAALCGAVKAAGTT